MTLARRGLGEFIGTAFLLMAVVGSGIAAQRLSPHDTGLQLLENALATGTALVAIILAVGSVSGAHLNPVVTTAAAGVYVAAQVAGAIVGAILANAIFSLPAVEWSTRTRSGGGLWLAEGIATFGLLLVVFGVVRSGRSSVAPFAVGAYITAAYWFTSSTSFANPAVTIARTMTDTFAGIAPSSVPMFLIAELVGAAIAVGAVWVLYPDIARVAPELLVPHADDAHTAAHVPEVAR